MVLLDASALIAALYDEPGGSDVATHLGDAAVLTVNLEEIAGALVRDGMPPAVAHSAIDLLDLDVLDYTIAMAWRSVDLRLLLPAGLGFADRACLAAAWVLGTPVVTADTAWLAASVAAGVQVISVR